VESKRIASRRYLNISAVNIYGEKERERERERERDRHGDDQHIGHEHIRREPFVLAHGMTIAAAIDALAATSDLAEHRGKKW